MALQTAAQNNGHAPTTEYKLIDCHFHLCDFRQTFADPSVLLGEMNSNGVDATIVFGMPLKQSFGAHEPCAPAYYLDNDAECYWDPATDYRIMSRLHESDSRLIPFICGIVPTDKDCEITLRETLSAFPNIGGIGELLLRHGSLTHKISGSKPRGRHDAVDGILSTAAEFELPVLVHNDIGAMGDRKPKYIDEVRYMCGTNPETKIIWAHCGINRGVIVHGVHDLLRGLLAEFPNLFLDLSWEVFWEQELLDPKSGKIAREWQCLIEDYSTRFVIGTDGVGENGVTSYAHSIEVVRTILNQLPLQASKDVAGVNLLRLLPRHVIPKCLTESVI